MPRFDINKIKPGWSHSKLDTFQCPFRFAKIYIDGCKEEPNPMTLAGRMVAECMAEYRTRWLEGNGSDIWITGTLTRFAQKTFADLPDEIFQLGIDALENGLNHILAIKPRHKETKQAWIEERIAFTDKWQRITFKGEDKQWWGTEAQRKKTWWRMQPDFMWLDKGDRLHIDDDKAFAWKDKDPQQIGSYAYCAAGMLGLLKNADIHCAYNLFGSRRRQAFTTTMERQRDFPDWLSNSVDAIMKTVDFEPRQCKACNYCGFVQDCPRHEKIGTQLATTPKFGSLDTPEKRIQAGLWLEAAERYIGVARKLIKASVGEHGPVVLGNGKQLEIVPRSRKELSADVFIGMLLGEGIDGKTQLENITLTTSDLNDILKKVYPMRGKGITKDIMEQNRAKRGAVEIALQDLWDTRTISSTLEFRDNPGTVGKEKNEEKT